MASANMSEVSAALKAASSQEERDAIWADLSRPVYFQVGNEVYWDFKDALWYSGKSEKQLRKTGIETRDPTGTVFSRAAGSYEVVKAEARKVSF